jgi:UDPglucose--hexose-1-phosphate uridylyltransferase
MSLEQTSHRRMNLLTGEWVLVSPQRSRRPWQGQIEADELQVLPGYDANCYLCPGNARAAGMRNPAYSGPYAFDNDFSALSGSSPGPAAGHRFFLSEPETGVCRVVCFSERHDLSLAEMTPEQACRALRFLSDEWRELDHRDGIGYVQVFENRGSMMGCSNHHPHAQIWATRSLPDEPGKELEAQRRYYLQHGRLLLLDYVEAELAAQSRIVCVNEFAVALVPFWAIWPFETMIVPRRAMAGLDEFSEAELAGYTDVFQRTLRACNRLFQTQVPYSMGFHARPSDGQAHPEWQLHAHIYPPLLRSATIRKYLVGFEMLGMPQRDLTPESAASNLRANVK